MVFDRDLIYALALDNALKHQGKAAEKAVLGKVLSIKPEYKKNIKELINIIREIVSYVNTLSLEKIESEFEVYHSLIPERKEVIEEYKLPPLPNAELGKVVTRFAPNPDFVLHLGSLRPLIVSHEYAKMYKGRFILRFEDTDPRTKKPEEEYYKIILDDIRWLGIEPDEIHYQSDRLELYYDIAKELIKLGYAYVCTCSSDEFSQYVNKGVPCPHRESAIEDNLELFDKMLNGFFNEGEAVLRIKTDLNHPNPSVRDWVALRIINVNKYPHPRVGDKYIVWPLYNFSCAIDDHYMGITHVFRGVEHKINEEKQRFIYKYLGWREPTYIHHGRLAIPGGILSKSKILKGIQEGIYTGIDDPRLLTVQSLRRRGFHPQALKNIILRVGISPSNAVIDFSLLASENRKIIDKFANRYFGVRTPFKIKVPIRNEIQHVKIRLHPDYPEKGYREFLFNTNAVDLFIDYEDKEYIVSGKVFRLIGLGNYRVIEKEGEYKAIYVDNDVKKAIRNKYRFIHWVPESQNIKASFIYPGESYEGYIEKNIMVETVDNVVQLERLGYFRIDMLENNYIRVFFSHT